LSPGFQAAKIVLFGEILGGVFIKKLRAGFNIETLPSPFSPKLLDKVNQKIKKTVYLSGGKD